MEGLEVANDDTETILLTLTKVDRIMQKKLAVKEKEGYLYLTSQVRLTRFIINFI